MSRAGSPMKGFVRTNSLSLFFFAILAASLVGQSFAGQHEYNAEQLAHDSPPVSWWGYVSSPAFWGAVMENWQ